LDLATLSFLPLTNLDKRKFFWHKAHGIQNGFIIQNHIKTRNSCRTFTGKQKRCENSKNSSFPNPSGPISPNNSPFFTSKEMESMVLILL
jgi:hypothetical protein